MTVVRVSQGVADMLPEAEHDLAILAQYLNRHQAAAVLDHRALAVRNRQQGAFFTEHSEVHVREEFGYAGNIIYVMTRRERVSDDATWLDIDFGGLLTSVAAPK